jgi:hypothetical protein
MITVTFSSHGGPITVILAACGETRLRCGESPPRAAAGTRPAHRERLLYT